MGVWGRSRFAHNRIPPFRRLSSRFARARDGKRGAREGGRYPPTRRTRPGNDESLSETSVNENSLHEWVVGLVRKLSEITEGNDELKHVNVSAKKLLARLKVARIEERHVSEMGDWKGDFAALTEDEGTNDVMNVLLERMGQLQTVVGEGAKVEPAVTLMKASTSALFQRVDSLEKRVADLEGTVADLDGRILAQENADEDAMAAIRLRAVVFALEGRVLFLIRDRRIRITWNFDGWPNNPSLEVIERWYDHKASPQDDASRNEVAKVFYEVFGKEGSFQDVCNLVSTFHSELILLSASYMRPYAYPVDITKEYVLERIATFSRMSPELNETALKSLVRYSEAARMRPEFAHHAPSQDPMEYY